MCVILCSHQILDEILQVSVEVPSDRDDTQGEVDCDHSGVDEGDVVCLIEFICHLFIYILYKLLCITACHSNFIPQTEFYFLLSLTGGHHQKVFKLVLDQE